MAKTGSPIKIRRAIPADAKEVKAAHYYAYQACYRGYLPDDFLDTMPFDQAVIERTANSIREHEYHVAEQDGHVIGFAKLDYPEEQAFEIQALYIHPDQQKQGAGSYLLQELCRLKREQGYKKLIIWTIKNGPSISIVKSVPKQIWL